MPNYNHLTPIDLYHYGDNVPRRNNPVSSRAAKKFLDTAGWQIVGEIPNIKKCVLLAVPHTSNIDGIYAIATLLALDIDISVMGKKQLFAMPVLGKFLRWSGVVAIDREKKGSTLQATIDQFNQREQFWLALAPEGTRSYVERLRTGFYHIAMGAGVPMLPIAMDYPTKQVRFMPLFYPTGDIDADMPKILDYYEGVKPRDFAKMAQPLQDLHK